MKFLKVSFKSWYEFVKTLKAKHIRILLCGINLSIPSFENVHFD